VKTAPIVLLFALACDGRGRAAATAAGPPKPALDPAAAATPEAPLSPKKPRGPTARNGPSAPKPGPPRLSELVLPPGFSIAVFADGLPDARSLALAPAGTLFVGTRERDRVYAVVDADGDRTADRVVTVARGLDSPNGVAVQDGALYVAEIGRIVRYDDIERRLDDPPEPVVVTDALPRHPHHGWRYARFGPDRLLYVGVGAPCDTCEREEPIFATISRMPAAGGALEPFAHGVRNSVGFDWHPETGALWFTDNGRDELGDDLPPDELNVATAAGRHFGYPYCHGGNIADPEFGDERPCRELVPPVRRLDPHVAALGMRFHRGAMFPATHRNAVFIAEHGSWNRRKKIGYRIMMVRVDGDRARGYEPFVTGWLDEAADEAWGRPVDVEVLDDGSLLVSDDWKGVIYRVSYAG
jgi:glucose/arabinose dehydrogenase